MTRRNERSRRAILDAALELATELGYQKLTIESVAARAGVGKQTIYRWWPSKGAVLFDALLARTQDTDGAGALPDTGDLVADLKAVLRATVTEFADPAFSADPRAHGGARPGSRTRRAVPGPNGWTSLKQAKQRAAQPPERRPPAPTSRCSPTCCSPRSRNAGCCAPAR